MITGRNKRKKEPGSNFSITDKKMREEEKRLVPWAELPSIALENIYTFLNREERCRMSMVCKNWNQEYSSPSLWRKMKFVIPKYDLNLEVYPEVKFARKYGNMFHHVEIVLPTELWFCNRRLIWKHIKLFLEALTFHSELETFTFLYVGHLFLDHTISDDLYLTLKNFFSSQHKLKTVEFRGAYFKKSEAVEILRVIFLNSKSIQNMCLEQFTDEEIDDEIIENNGNLAVTFESFLNIKTLQIDYSQVFENIMITIYEHAQNSDSRRLKGNLELIQLFCDGNEASIYRYQGIPPECWKLFTKICPSLRINLTFQFEDEIRKIIDLFVVRNMPLKMLTCNKDWYRRQTGPETEIGVLFRHLQSCRTNEYLEDLTINWKGNADNLADLINFLQTCEKLRKMDLYIEHPIETLDTVFISWLENRPSSLQNVLIDVGVGNAQRRRAAAIYSNMADDYCPLLQIRGLNLRLIVSKIRKRAGVR